MCDCVLNYYTSLGFEFYVFDIGLAKNAHILKAYFKFINDNLHKHNRFWEYKFMLHTLINDGYTHILILEYKDNQHHCLMQLM